MLKIESPIKKKNIVTTVEVSFPVHDAEAGRSICEFLAGKSFYNFNAICSSYPCRGNERVHVTTTDVFATETGVTEMVMHLLASMATGHA